MQIGTGMFLPRPPSFFYLLWVYMYIDYAILIQSFQKKCIFAFVILTGNFIHTGKRLALFLTDESGQFVVTGIMFNRLCLAISGFALAIAKREQLNLIRHARPSRADQ